MQTSSALDPQSPLARAIYDLGIVSGVVFALIFVIVTGAIIYAIFRFPRARVSPTRSKFRVTGRWKSRGRLFRSSSSFFF